MNNQSLPINQLASKTLPISDLRLRTTAYSLLIVALHYLTYPEKVLTSGNLHNHLNRYFRRTTARRSATSNLILFTAHSRTLAGDRSNPRLSSGKNGIFYARNSCSCTYSANRKSDC